MYEFDVIIHVLPTTLESCVEGVVDGVDVAIRSVDHPVTVLIDIVSAFSPKVKIIGLLTATIVLGSALAPNSGATGLPPGSPTAAIVVDGKTIELPLEIDNNGVATLDQWVDGEPGQWQATLDLLIDPDPSILVAGSVIDFGAPSTFSLSFSQPIVSTAAPGVATNTVTTSTTDAGAPSGTSITALAPPAGIPTDGSPEEIFVYSLSTDGGSTFLNAGLDLNPSFVGASPSESQSPFNEGPVAGPALIGAFYDVMRVDANFGMTGGGDTFTFNGMATINVVPEPSSLALAAIALLLTGVYGYRHRG